MVRPPAAQLRELFELADLGFGASISDRARNVGRRPRRRPCRGASVYPACSMNERLGGAIGNGHGLLRLSALPDGFAIIHRHR